MVRTAEPDPGRLRRKVDEQIAAAKMLVARPAIAQVAFHDPHIAGDVPCQLARATLEVVDDGHVGAALRQRRHEIGPEKAAPAADDDVPIRQLVLRHRVEVSAVRLALEYPVMMPVMARQRVLAFRAAFVLVCVAGLIVACGRTDSELQAAVDAELAIDESTGTVAFDVGVANGVVSLAGAVRTLEQQRRAVAIARDVDGVKDVNDESVYLDNAVLAEAVKTALASDPMVGRIPFTVNARHGTVELVSDQTNEQDRTRAVAVASAVRGVKRVEDLMR